MESSDETQDMSKGQLSSITRFNRIKDVSPNRPLVPEEALAVGTVQASGSVAPDLLSTIRKWELNEKQLVTITEKTSQLYFQGAEVEKIPKEEAVCRFCFNLFQDDNVLKTKCKCKFTLIHESCTVEWSEKKGNKKCDVCEQDIQNIPVTLSTDQTLQTLTKSSRGILLNRFYGCIGSSADQ
ncbi:hypothetical protein CDL12_01468 [Handroanthus impetiginosus]|uniref:RING-CH-type domain-containing protein n=1 Tax=Handroanthus impetiginosus TaxID=429701 RepID=A0A2G9I7R4_9LAMI|nr:hypothetical protein CDL12_01468 [Handroanthus impetiginosus]